MLNGQMFKGHPLEPSRQHPNAQAQPCLSSEGELCLGAGVLPQAVGGTSLGLHETTGPSHGLFLCPKSLFFLLCLSCSAFQISPPPCKTILVFKTKSQAIQSYSSKSNCNSATLHIYLYKMLTVITPWALGSNQLPRDQIYASRISSKSHSATLQFLAFSDTWLLALEIFRTFTAKSEAERRR